MRPKIILLSVSSFITYREAPTWQQKEVVSGWNFPKSELGIESGEEFKLRQEMGYWCTSTGNFFLSFFESFLSFF